MSCRKLRKILLALNKLSIQFWLDSGALPTDRVARFLGKAELIPMQLGPIGETLRACLRRYPVDTLKEGDFLINNDPFEGGQHIPDVFIFTPIFVNGRVVGFGASVAHHLDLGGGLGVPYLESNEVPPHPSEYAAIARAALGDLGLKLVLEPGRNIVGNAGVLVTRVIFVKAGEGRRFTIVDAAMNDVPRPAMYEAFHQIAPLGLRDKTPTMYDVVGPVCESGDWLGRDRSLAVEAGDVLAILSTGAYCMAMASNYNSRPRAAEVMVDAGQAQLIRQREDVNDLFAHERMMR